MRDYRKEIEALSNVPSNSAAFIRKLEQMLFSAHEEGRESFGSALNMSGVYSPETPYLNRLFKEAINDKEKAEVLVTELNPKNLPTLHKSLYETIQNQLQHKCFEPNQLQDKYVAIEFGFGDAAKTDTPDLINIAQEEAKKATFGNTLQQALDSLKTTSYEAVKNKVIENIPAEREGNNVFIANDVGLDWVFTQISEKQEGGALMPSALNNYPVANFRGDHTIIGGMSFGGKTSAMMSIVRDCVIRKEPVLIFSAEMTIMKLMIMLIPMLSDLRKSEIIGGNGLPLDRQMLLIEFTNLIKDLIIIDATSNPTTAYIKQAVKKYSKIYKIERVLLDYIQLVIGAGSGEQERYADVAYTMKSVAKEFNIHAISLAQLSREHTKRLGDEMIPRLSDLRSSGTFEQSADEIIFIFLFELYKQFGYRAESSADGYLIWRKRRILDMPREYADFAFLQNDGGIQVVAKSIKNIDDGSGFDEVPMFKEDLKPKALPFQADVMNSRRSDGEIPF